MDHSQFLLLCALIVLMPFVATGVLYLIYRIGTRVPASTLQSAQAVPAPLSMTDDQIKDAVRPFVVEAMAMDLTGHQKRMQVILGFLKQHPHVSMDTAGAAIEIVLSEIRKDGN